MTRETVTNPVQRADFDAIAGWVRPGAHVLDLGCGDGALLAYLTSRRNVTGYGVEIDDASVLACVKNGVNVIQGDLERGLEGFADHSFDYVILSQTLQAMKNTDRVVGEMLRVGREGIVTFPNFGYWKNRVQIALGGHMPVSDNLPYQWWDTPNVHLCTMDDFEGYCAQHGVRILERIVFAQRTPVTWLANLRGSLAVYRFEKAAAVA
jgi:methionine biosynthesis protein MetW